MYSEDYSTQLQQTNGRLSHLQQHNIFAPNLLQDLYFIAYKSICGTQYMKV